ncbi:uncharacterized protein LOC34624661 [Cyclospora cayetanensis]|uniref:Uncharacterized protein LOC34624661 n=1 Tax=Cyclospora cayetanensis TaxID=88456 RepID=A0A6P6S0G6_9EIME|nr:uncharacterized protein LOC34624661 [Cyclospora cayetanensis]
MTQDAFATALYEQLPEEQADTTAAIASAAASAARKAASLRRLAARTLGVVADDENVLRRQQTLLRRAALLQQGSFFELLAQQKLLDGLHAALRHCVVTLESFYARQLPAAAGAARLSAEQRASATATPAVELQNAVAAVAAAEQQRQLYAASTVESPQLRLLSGSRLFAWLWRRLSRLAAAASASAASAEPRAVRRLLALFDAAAVLRWIDVLRRSGSAAAVHATAAAASLSAARPRFFRLLPVVPRRSCCLPLLVALHALAAPGVCARLSRRSSRSCHACCCSQETPLVACCSGRRRAAHAKWAGSAASPAKGLRMVVRIRSHTAAAFRPQRRHQTSPPSTTTIRSKATAPPPAGRLLAGTFSSRGAFSPV